MSKLFTFYNRAVEDCAPITVYDYDDKTYELIWGIEYSCSKYESKYKVDAKVRSGEYEIVEDFRKTDVLFTFTPDDKNFTNSGKEYEVRYLDKDNYKVNLVTSPSTWSMQSKVTIERYLEEGTYKLLKDFRAKPSVKQIDIVPCPAFSATLALSKDNFRSTKEFKSVKELKEYVEALEKVFGNA